MPKNIKGTHHLEVNGESFCKHELCLSSGITCQHNSLHEAIRAKKKVERILGEPVNIVARRCVYSIPETYQDEVRMTYYTHEGKFVGCEEESYDD
jgi:hypothetical protein